MRTRRGALARSASVAASVIATAAIACADPLTVTPNVSLAETFTNNVFFDDRYDNDAITRLLLHLSLDYQTPRSTTTLSGGTSAAFSARAATASVNLAQAQRVTLTTSYIYSPLVHLTLADHFGRVGSGIRDLGFIDNPSPGGGPNTPPPDNSDPGGSNPSNVNIILPSGSAFSNSLGAGMSYLFAPLWTLSLGLTNGVNNFGSSSGIDVSQGIGITVGYQYSETLGLNGRLGYGYFYSEKNVDSDTYSLSFGPSYEPASLWRISALLGGTMNRTISTGGLRGTADVRIDATRVLENSLVSAGIRNGFTPNLGIGNGISQTFDVHLGYSRKLTERLSGSTSFSYSHFDNSNTFDLFTLRAGLSYPIWQNFHGSLTYGYHRTDGGAVRSSSAAGRSTGVVDSNVVSLQISWGAPLWQFDL